MTIDTDGYLSGELAGVEAENLQKFAKEVAAFTQANRLGMRVLYALPQESLPEFDGSHMFLVGVLLCIVLRRCQAAVHLALRGLGGESSTLTRSALEALFILRSFLTDPKRVLYCLDQGDADSKVRWANAIVATQKKHANLTAEQFDQVLQTLAQNKRREQAVLSYENHARWGDAEVIYTMMYRALSTAASHLTATVLEAHATWTATARTIEFGPDEDVAIPIGYALTVLLNTLPQLADRLGMAEFDEEIRTLVNDVCSSADDLHNPPLPA